MYSPLAGLRDDILACSARVGGGASHHTDTRTYTHTHTVDACAFFAGGNWRAITWGTVHLLPFVATPHTVGTTQRRTDNLLEILGVAGSTRTYLSRTQNPTSHRRQEAIGYPGRRRNSRRSGMFSRIRTSVSHLGINTCLAAESWNGAGRTRRAEPCHRASASGWDKLGLALFVHLTAGAPFLGIKMSCGERWFNDKRYLGGEPSCQHHHHHHGGDNPSGRIASAQQARLPWQH